MPALHRTAAFALLYGTALSPASAQVSVYGLIDTSVEWMNKVGANSDSLTRMPNLTASAPSRLGLRGREDLGGGLSAQFALEMGIASDSGAMNNGNRAFGRQAVVSLHGPWGQVGLGRQYNMLFWSLVGTDVIGPSLHSMASLDSYIPNARSDNSITYQTGWGDAASRWTVGASYSLGRDTVNAGPSPAGTNCAGEANGSNAQACRDWSLMLKYDSPRWGAAASHLQLNGGTGAFAGLTSANLRDKRSLLTGYANIDQLKIGAGWLRRDNDGNAAAPRSDLFFVGATYRWPQFTLDAQLSHLRPAHSANKASLLVLRGAYHLSKRTAAYASLGYISNKGAAAYGASSAAAGGLPAPGVNQTGIGVGLRHTF